MATARLCRCRSAARAGDVKQRGVVVVPSLVLLYGGEQGIDVGDRFADGGQASGEVDETIFAQPGAVGGEAFECAVGVEQQPGAGRQSDG
jgi:hypothetical protein